jgi:hypothetical protein
MARPGNSLTTRSRLDNFIIGFLILFAIVFAMELALFIPCGSWEELSTCEDLPAVAAAMWEPYYEIDPLFKEMPLWYSAIMNVQDALFNPWWLLSLVLFWTGRQEAAWYRLGTFLVSGFIIGTSYIAFSNWVGSPEYTVPMVIAMTLINGPWIAGPLLFSWRLRPREDSEVGSYTATESATVGCVLMALPSVIYVGFQVIALGIT